MKKWVKADLRCIDITDTKFSTEFNVDFDGGYIGDGAQQGFLESSDSGEGEVSESEEAAQIVFESTDVLS